MSETTEIDAGSAALTALGGALAQAGAASLTGQRERMAEGLLRASLKQWEDPQIRPRLLEGLLAALTSEAGAAQMRDFMSSQSSQIFTQLGKALGVSQAMDINQVAELLEVPALNINAAQAQVWGLVVLRYIVELEPVASATADDIVDVFAPTIQRYLVG
ncbi:TetR/AcrR family transcriptional regulator [Streptomyces sp. NPDC002740]|uniref:Tetracyclin repressor-like C-terminal domain-containing protein n=1 Tax=Streptomyces asoensis TaxID=249586 RepID=A0A6M4X0X5_9ACTN|nr:hypothetical protein [Streptomyces asoensis]QJS99002.1 hypothetical protein G9272_00485 [Streptomyces asoensis]QJT06467.1 hypothetical protein G9272_44410 [Streptomyces asoensis]